MQRGEDDEAITVMQAWSPRVAGDGRRQEGSGDSLHSGEVVPAEFLGRVSGAGDGGEDE